MTTDRVPVEIPEEMVEAGALAIFRASTDPRHDYVEWPEWVSDEAVRVFLNHAEACLSAALLVVLSDPCPICSARWGEPPPARKAKGSGTCPDEFHNSPPPPVWAWLRVAQDAGMVEHAPLGAVATEMLTEGEQTE